MIVGFSTRDAWSSKIVRYFTKSECSHCFLYDPELGIIYHAQGLMVHALSYTNFVKKNKIVWQTAPQKIDWLWLREQLGKPYGTFTLLGHIIPILFKKRNPFNDSDHSLICSELVARCMSIEGAESKTPNDLMLYLRDGKPLA